MTVTSSPPALPRRPLPQLPPLGTPTTPAGGRSTTGISLQPAFPCFMCNRSFGNQERFMLVHACRAHAGDVITPSAQARLTASGRGMCSTEHCVALRKHTETYCRKCKLHAPVRSLTATECRVALHVRALLKQKRRKYHGIFSETTSRCQSRTRTLSYPKTSKNASTSSLHKPY